MNLKEDSVYLQLCRRGWLDGYVPGTEILNAWLTLKNINSNVKRNTLQVSISGPLQLLNLKNNVAPSWAKM